MKYIASAENVRFLTGVQRVTRPICPTLKFGLQLLIVAWLSAGTAAQKFALATSSYRTQAAPPNKLVDQYGSQLWLYAPRTPKASVRWRVPSPARAEAPKPSLGV